MNRHHITIGAPTGIALLTAVAVAVLTLGAAAILVTALGEDGVSTARTPRAEPADRAREKVLEVESGDTFSAGTATGRRLTHIIGIDAPEPGQCGFERARRHLRSMIEDRRVALYSDTVQPDRDAAGRRLRYAVVGSAANPRDVGYRSVASGWARVSLEHDFLLVAQYLQAQAKAQRERRGVWRCDRRKRR